MGAGRAERFKIRSGDAKETKLANRVYKDKERARRSDRMVAKLSAGKLPYTPAVMSWLSLQLDKASGKITDADVKSFLRKQ